MSILSEISAESKEFDFGGKKILLQPLSVKEMLQVMRVSKDKGMVDGTELMIKLTFKKSVPDATDQEIDNLKIPVSILGDFISELNNLPKPSPEDIEELKKAMR